MITLISAPSNLGLRPPQAGAVPGAAKAPEALREAGLFERMATHNALDGGVVLPGRYVDDDRSREPGVVRNQGAIIDHARRLATRLTETHDAGRAPLVLGGDCSLLVAAGLAARDVGRGGLVHIDGHTDFRHPGNSNSVGSLAGEDLAAAIGRHSPSISRIGARGPYFEASSTVHVGCRDNDENLEEVRAALRHVHTASEVTAAGTRATASRILSSGMRARGFWLHVDVDVLDPVHMPAVDSPEPGGFEPDEFTGLLGHLAPYAWGAAIMIFDPDLDPTGEHARSLAGLIEAGLYGLGTAL